MTLRDSCIPLHFYMHVHACTQDRSIDTLQILKLEKLIKPNLVVAVIKGCNIASGSEKMNLI